jgi:hypothetical protein
MIKRNNKMKRAAGLSVLLLSLLTLKVSGQITGAVVTPSAFNVGSVLTAGNTGTPESGNHVDFEWFYSPSRTSIGTSSAYTVPASDQGKIIYITATEKLDADNSVVRSFSSSNITVNSYPVASYVGISGSPRSGMILSGTYVYADADYDSESGTTFQWYRGTSPGGTGQTLIGSATLSSYTLTNSDIGYYIGFSVTPSSSAGSVPGIPVTSTVWTGPVLANSAPSASSVTITGSLNVNGVLTGHYTYSDSEGDIESGSSFEWLSSFTSGGTYTAIPFENSISHQITMGEQGMYFKFSVTPKAATGTTMGTKDTTASYEGPANSKPYADGVTITGSAEVASVLTGNYNYHDADWDPQGTSLFQWYRGTDPIAGAESLTYTLTIYDVDKNIIFKVTPVSSGSGYPNTGNSFASSAVGPVTDPASTSPVATNLCIDGTRQPGQQLTGKYEYVNGYDESGSKYLWFRNKTLLKSGTNSTDKKYTLVTDDIDKNIIFAVIPENNRSQVGDTAFSATLSVFNMAQSVFSVADSAQLLLAKPMGGVFSGPGVTNGYFYPATIGTSGSPYTIQYTLNVGTATTCFQKAYTSLSVNPIVVYFEGIKSAYCDNNLTDTVYVRNVPPAAWLKNFNITDPNSNLHKINDTTAVFDPDRMKSGDKADTIYYSYLYGISYVQIKRALVIDHFGVVSIRNLDAGSQICNNLTPFDLFTYPSGGIFTGPVAAGKLDPSLVTHMGETIVTYTYTSPKGCSQKVTVPITVNQSPVVDFAPADSCILNDSDSTRFLNRTDSPDAMKAWVWEFSESGSTITNYRMAPSYLYTTGGDHKVILTATTVKDCKSSKEITIDLGKKPVAGFTWLNECYHTGDSLLFKDNTVSFSTIISRRWNFFDGDSLHTIKDLKYPQKSVGWLKVEYTVNTSYRGCNDIITRNIYVRPTITLVSGDSSFENFENGAGGWVKDYKSVNSWTFGTPDRSVIKSAASGSNAWYTGYLISKRDTAFYSVVSPCFDFTNIKRPMIRMKLWKWFEQNRNGASLQYKIGDTGSWEYVGTIDDGIRWFNSALIGRPGGNLVGWTTSSPDPGWSVSRHRLDWLEGKKDVKFRISYGSDGTSNTDGIAFDDIWIGERTRNMLLEHFENISGQESSTATALVNSIIAHNKKDVINIQYHTNFPLPDPYYNDNPGDVSARVLYYGLTRSPYAFIDGGFDRDNFAGLFDYYLSNIDSLTVIRRSLTTPLFKINIISDVSDGVLSAGGKITSLGKINAENMTLYIAVTEKMNKDHTGYGTDTVFYNVFRKFIPDAGGINIKKVWTPGEELTIPEQTWVIQNIKSSSDIEVIAFLQNNITKEVYQATSVLKPNITTGIGEVLNGTGKDFSLYPNPAVNKLTIGFSEPLTGDSDIKIYNLQGLLVSAYKAGPGISEYIVGNLKLKTGIYLVRVSMKGVDLGFRKLIITGD